MHYHYHELQFFKLEHEIKLVSFKLIGTSIYKIQRQTRVQTTSLWPSTSSKHGPLTINYNSFGLKVALDNELIVIVFQYMLGLYMTNNSAMLEN